MSLSNAGVGIKIAALIGLSTIQFPAMAQAPIPTLVAVVDNPSTPMFALAIESPWAQGQRGWYVAAEANALKRWRMNDRTFVVDPGTGAMLLSTADFEPGFAVGPRLKIGNELSDYAAFEFTTFWQTGFSDYAWTTRSTMRMVQPFVNQEYYSPLPPIGSFPTVVEMACQTQIASFELNYRHWCYNASNSGFRFGALVGPRCILLNEQFQDFDNLNIARGLTDADTAYRTWTSNSLVGVAVGAMFEIRPTPALVIAQESKIGGFANFTNSTNELEFQNGGQVFRASASDTRFSGNIELSLGFRWKARSWLEIDAGYRAVYLWNLAGAPDAVSFNLLQQTNQNNELAFWLHGPNAGIVVHF